MTKHVVHTQTDEAGTISVGFQQKARVWMQIIVRLIILVVGLVILASPNPLLPIASDEGTKKFAAGWVGAVIGYWLS